MSGKIIFKEKESLQNQRSVGCEEIPVLQEDVTIQMISADANVSNHTKHKMTILREEIGNLNNIRGCYSQKQHFQQQYKTVDPDSTIKEVD